MDFKWMRRCTFADMHARIWCLIFWLVLGRVFPSDLSDSIRASIQCGAGFLYTIQRDDGAICDSLNPLFETWETIAALEALVQAGTDTTDPVFRRAWQWLGTQVQPSGLVCHNRRCRNAWCLETTAELVKLNALMNRESDYSIADSLMHWQHHDGSWDIGNPDVQEWTDFPSVTAFGLRTLNLSHGEVNAKKLALRWLSQRIRQDSLWGAAWEYYGTIRYAAWPATEALVGCTGKESQNMLAIIRKWLRVNRAIKTNPGGISSELETALMLSAWMPIIQHERNIRKDLPLIISQVRYLLACQRNDGSWDGGIFPVPNVRFAKQEYVFCTARVVSALSQLLQLQIL